jgi:hypothetical protein
MICRLLGSVREGSFATSEGVKTVAAESTLSQCSMKTPGRSWEVDVVKLSGKGSQNRCKSYKRIRFQKGMLLRRENADSSCVATSGSNKRRSRIKASAGPFCECAAVSHTISRPGQTADSCLQPNQTQMEESGE